MVRRLVPVALALLAVLAAGCQARVDVTVDVGADAAGEVRVGVGLDEAALELLGRAEGAFATEDLRSRGWKVTGPATEDDGLTWLRATKAFASPAEAEAVLAEVSGPDGPFSDFAVVTSRTAMRDEVTVSGTVDLTGGLDGFTDAELRQRIGGDLVEQLEPLRQRVDAALEEAFRFRVAVELPGDVSSNAPVELDDAAVWTPRLGDRLEFVARSSRVRTATLVWWSVGGVALVAGLALLGVRWWGGRRRAEEAVTPPP